MKFRKTIFPAIALFTSIGTTLCLVRDGLSRVPDLSLQVTTRIAQRPVVQTYEQGYQDRYRLGYQNGKNFRKYNAGFHPVVAFQAEFDNSNPNYKEGFREGFYIGFSQGYDDRPYNSEVLYRTPAPMPAPLEPPVKPN